MSVESGRKPLPHEHKEIARGSGAAAILMFLHIALSGYLGSVVYYLLRYNSEMFWHLAPFRSALLFYWPAAFALLTYLPTNALTRTVARVAMMMGVLAVLTYVAGLVWLAARGESTGYAPDWVTAFAVVCGAGAGWATRALFARSLRKEVELS